MAHCDTQARLFFGLVVMLTYPLECFVVREVLATLAGKDPTNLSAPWHYGVTFGICGCVLAIALVTSNLGAVDLTCLPRPALH